MAIIYVALFLLGSSPLTITLRRFMMYRAARNRAGNTVATVTHIRTHRHARGLPYDTLTLTYHNLKTGMSKTGQIAMVRNKYKPGDRVTIAREPNSAKIFIPEDVSGFYPML